MSIPATTSLDASRFATSISQIKTAEWSGSPVAGAEPRVALLPESAKVLPGQNDDPISENHLLKLHDDYLPNQHQKLLGKLDDHHVQGLISER